MFSFSQLLLSDSLLLNGTYGIKRAHFKQSNPHMYRHVRLGAATELYLLRLSIGVHGGQTQQGVRQ